MHHQGSVKSTTSATSPTTDPPTPQHVGTQPGSGGASSDVSSLGGQEDEGSSGGDHHNESVLTRDSLTPSPTNAGK